ncbi:hypothetical protein HPP92_020468 [Vanilla planifolia]|uniref:Uncharacterized protein n=1 Tax=Vanilla planifolia TaxID=51239 RepID=A0A835UHM4_VANPL|nr:hypothetical protein HPP92_020468 [Vanilla planifolia]
MGASTTSAVQRKDLLQPLPEAERTCWNSFGSGRPRSTLQHARSSSSPALQLTTYRDGRRFVGFAFGLILSELLLFPACFFLCADCSEGE